MTAQDEQRRPGGRGGGADALESGRVVEHKSSEDRTFHSDSTDSDRAIQLLTASWLDIAGERLAQGVATGALCNRCARLALMTIGIAGGIPPGRLVRECLLGYSRTLTEITDALAHYLRLDDGLNQ